jgi:DNA-binding NarL/FixJ family response regulator
MNRNTADPTKLLLADDSPDFRCRLIEMLSELDGVDIVGPACNSRQALTLFEQTHPHAVVLDIEMPSMNGLEVLEAIRQRNRVCLVIMVTAHDGDELSDFCLESGADYFISKNRDLDRLVDVVREFSEVS